MKFNFFLLFFWYVCVRGFSRDGAGVERMVSLCICYIYIWEARVGGRKGPRDQVRG